MNERVQDISAVFDFGHFFDDMGIDDLATGNWGIDIRPIPEPPIWVDDAVATAITVLEQSEDFRHSANYFPTELGTLARGAAAGTAVSIATAAWDGEVTVREASAISGEVLIGGAAGIVMAALSAPVVISFGTAVVATEFGAWFGEAVYDVFDFLLNAEDPDGGVNGVGQVSRSYGSAIVPGGITDGTFDPLGYGPSGMSGLAQTIPFGFEYNALDQIAHENFYEMHRARREGRDPYVEISPNPHARTHFSESNPSGDRNHRNDNDWRRPEPVDDGGPRGANERGMERGSGGGFSSTGGQGSGGTGSSIGYSKPSPTGYDSRSPYDEDGPGVSLDHDSSYGEAFSGPKPILLDLDGTGVRLTELSESTQYIDSGNSGLKHKTAWAGAGDGVLFFDPDGRDAITETRQYVFTEWDPGASSDLEALRSAFDSSGDGKLTSADAVFAKFKVLVTKADGTSEVKTLTQLNITEIDLTGDATHIELPDGSLITGQTSFTRGESTTETVADTTLVVEAQGCITSGIGKDARMPLATLGVDVFGHSSDFRDTKDLGCAGKVDFVFSDGNNIPKSVTLSSNLRILQDNTSFFSKALGR
ncbi:MAG: hypothetical protein AAF689_16565 [Pseudomonadota bacterium]